jgi:hypothetical protein
LQPQIGLSAVNDALLLQSGVHNILQLELRHHPSISAISRCIQTVCCCFIHIMQSVQAERYTTYGQMLDTEQRPIDEMTQCLYDDIVRLKTSHYTFYLPVQIALIIVCFMFLSF